MLLKLDCTAGTLYQMQQWLILNVVCLVLLGGTLHC